MKENNLSATKFADKIGVPRSGLSHVLKGRNKASLDYVLKIIEHFPQIDSMWLLTGKGKTKFVNGDEENADKLSSDIHKSISSLNKDVAKSRGDMMQDVLANNEFSMDESFDYSPNDNSKASITSNSQIERIIIFFMDGSFKEYKN